MHEPGSANNIRAKRVLRELSRHRDDDVSCNRCYTAVGDKQRLRPLEKIVCVAEVSLNTEHFAEPDSADAERQVSIVIGRQRLSDKQQRCLTAVRARDERLQLPLS